MSVAQAASDGCLRREYLGQDEEAHATPLRLAAIRPVRAERGFTLRAHRLSSLLRRTEKNMKVLIKSYRPPSSCPKYSAGVRGREAPAPARQGDRP